MPGGRGDNPREVVENKKTGDVQPDAPTEAVESERTSTSVEDSAVGPASTSSPDDRRAALPNRGRAKANSARHCIKQDACDPVTGHDRSIATIRCNVVEQLGKTTQVVNRLVSVANPPRSARDLIALPRMNCRQFMDDLSQGRLDQICVIITQDDHTSSEKRTTNSVRPCSHLGSATVEGHGALRPNTQAEMDEKKNNHHRDDQDFAMDTKIHRFESQGWDSLKKTSPFYDLLWEYRDVFPDEVPAQLPSDKGTRHEIDLVPGTKYCVTRQWPLPREQVQAIDEFFEKRRLAGQVRESKSPHSTPTFCVKKATGGYRRRRRYRERAC